MKNLFIDDNEEFVVNFFVVIKKDGSILCDVDEESLLKSMEGISDLKDCPIESYEAKFKKPSFGDSVGLYNSIFNTNEKGSMSFNPVMARLNIISSLIKEWNLNDDKKFEKPTEERIKRLHPIIASVIGIQLDTELGGFLS